MTDPRRVIKKISWVTQKATHQVKSSSKDDCLGRISEVLTSQALAFRGQGTATKEGWDVGYCGFDGEADVDGWSCGRGLVGITRGQVPGGGRIWEVIVGDLHDRII